MRLRNMVAHSVAAVTEVAAREVVEGVEAVSKSLGKRKPKKKNTEKTGGKGRSSKRKSTKKKGSK